MSTPGSYVCWLPACNSLLCVHLCSLVCYLYVLGFAGVKPSAAYLYLPTYLPRPTALRASPERPSAAHLSSLSNPTNALSVQLRILCQHQNE